MAEPLRRTGWTWNEYIAWEATQPIRYELVDGQVHAMGGGTAEHDTIGNNLRGELRERLRSTPCRAQGPDLKVAAGENGRYPDALIDCGPRVPGSLTAQDPVAVFEVLSKTTSWIDLGQKVRDYDAVPGIGRYVLISQDDVRALVYARGADGHLSITGATFVTGLWDTIPVPEAGIELPMDRLYEGLSLPPGGP